MKVYFGPHKPDRIAYFPRPDSMLKDVWLRKNIEEYDVEDESMDEDGKPKEKTTHKEWKADEVYMLTEKNIEDIEADFDNCFYEAGPQPTIDERIEVIEGLLGEMMEG